VKHYLSEGAQPVYRRQKAPSKLDPFKDIIEGWLEREPRLRATRIHQDLVRDYGFSGNYQTVRRHVQQIKEQLDGVQPELVFQFECVTRGKLMFREQEKLQLLRRFRQAVGPDVPWVGFYTIGEIGPVEEHNRINRFASVILARS
jgi:hypothetical protein